MKLLIVESDAAYAALLRTEVARVGIDTRLATNAEAAIEIARIERFDCILIDLDLSDTSGLAVINRLSILGVRTPIVVLTGVYDVQLKREARGEHGVAAYLEKPCTPARIIEQIEHIVGPPNPPCSDSEQSHRLSGE
jgi:two-component system OmpR family response regulator